MWEFCDSLKGVSWKKVTRQDELSCDKERAMINLWASPDIKEFLSNRYPIGELMYNYLGQNSSICYCYVDSSVKGKEDTIIGDGQQKDLAGAVLLYNPFNKGEAMSIEAIVVNPKLVGYGIATKMVASIRDNPWFFGNELHTGKLMSAVHIDNVASHKVFLKNKFKVMSKPSKLSFIDRCLTYYTYDKELEK